LTLLFARPAFESVDHSRKHLRGTVLEIKAEAGCERRLCYQPGGA
jgi:hypothetical protein